MPLAAGDRIGSYEILAPLGEGSMGEVYRARDLKLGRDVAIKVLPDHLSSDEARRQRFQHEAKVLATLNHPNVATIYGLNEDGGRVSLVMELVNGAPLDSRIGHRGLPLREALKIATQIAAGLEAAHRVGVVHRDLKPANVLVNPSGGVKLVDFGIAKVVQSFDADDGAAPTRTESAPRTAEGQIVGTVAYMSPEQARGELVDARSDLFSFGALFYEMLTGQRAFRAGDSISTLAAILNSEPPLPSTVGSTSVPREVERVVLRCLRKDRERRFQNASDLKLALEDLAEDTATTMGAQPSTMPRRRGWARTAVGLAGVAVVAAVAAWVFRSGPLESGRPRLRQLTFEAGVAITPALSRDGKLLAYASDRSGEPQLDIWLKQIAGGEPLRLTSGPDSKVNPQFSPDGTRVYFLGGRNDIYEVPALGGISRKVFDSAGPFSVSSRGDIAFHRPGTGTAPGPMFVLTAGNAAAEAWHPECASAGAPIWSPDGDRIAFPGFCRGVTDGGILGGILVAPLSVGAVTRLVGVDRQSATPDNLQSATNAPRGAWLRLANGSDALLMPRQTGDSVNLTRVGLDGETGLVTQGTGFETWPVMSPSGEVIFMRAEQTPSVWSVPLSGGGPPSKEASPARIFATSQDGSKLVFGRMLGNEQGQLVLRDRAQGTETVLASHKVVIGGAGSFWPQVSVDGRRVVYRINSPTGTEQYLVSAAGGSPRRSVATASFALASDWSSNGERVIGECRPLERGICELLPDTDVVRPLLAGSGGAQLLYPSFSWDGRWVTFMHRAAGRTRIVVTPVLDNGGLGGEDRWVPISAEDAEGARPRFSPDGGAMFYQSIRGNVVTIVRQRLDAATKRPIGQPVRLASVLNVPQSVLNIGLQYVLTVTRDRLFYNTAEIRSNVWMTRLE